MTGATAYAASGKDTPLQRVGGYLDLFVILFGDYFGAAGKRFITRAVHARIAAFLRGLEALLRRVLLIQAAAMIPTLPPAKAAAPKTPAAPRPAPQPSELCARAPSFCAFRQPPQVAERGASNRSSPRSSPAALADLRPLSRRYQAILGAIAAPLAKARRLAFRLRPLYALADGCAPQIIDTPRLHRADAHYLERDLDIWREDANEALRALLPDPDSS